MNKIFKVLIITILLLCFVAPNVYAEENSNSNSKCSRGSDANADFMETGTYVYCGGNDGSVLITNIPYKIPKITKMIYNAFMIVTPTILVVMGTIDLFRGITSSKEDELKKGRDTFVRRLIASVIVFLVVLGVKFIIGLIAGSSDNSNRIVGCIDCFVSNNCSATYTVCDDEDGE